MPVAGTVSPSLSRITSVVLRGIPRLGDLHGLLEPGEELGLAGREGVVHGQVAEDVAHDLEVVRVDHHGFGAVVDGHDAHPVAARAGCGSKKESMQLARALHAALLLLRARRRARRMLGETSSTRSTWCRIVGKARVGSFGGVAARLGSRAASRDPTRARRAPRQRRYGAARAQAAGRARGSEGEVARGGARGGACRASASAPRSKRCQRRDQRRAGKALPRRVPQAEGGQDRRGEEPQARDAPGVRSRRRPRRASSRRARAASGRCAGRRARGLPGRPA